MPLICIKNLSFKYESNLVLDKINLDINAGEYLGIVGPNGGGKTTLVKLIVGILKDSQHSIKIKSDIKFGYIPQRLSSSGLDFPAKVSEILKNSFVKFDQTKYLDLLKLCEIDKLENRLLSELSGGERQKVFIAKSLITNPDFLILDEPTTGIDPQYKIKFWELLKILNEQNKIGVIIISHDSHEILSNANRLILIDKKVQKDTSPQHFGHFHSH
jgi:zinc transport system ATP-binding protein